MLESITYDDVEMQNGPKEKWESDCRDAQATR